MFWWNIGSSVLIAIVPSFQYVENITFTTLGSEQHEVLLFGSIKEGILQARH